MPGRLLKREADLGRRPGRSGPGDIPAVGRTRPWPALLCAQPRLDWAARGLLPQAGGQLPRPHLEGANTRDLVLGLPRADGGAMARDAPRGPSRWPPGTAGLVLTPPHARPGRGWVCHAARSACAPRGASGAPRQERAGGRYGRRSWRGHKSRRAVRCTARPVVCSPDVARAASVQCARSSPPPAGPAVTPSWSVGPTVRGLRLGGPGAPWRCQPATPRAGACWRQSRTVGRCPPTSWAMVWRLRPRLALHTA
jgi:hypothetical protein